MLLTDEHREMLAERIGISKYQIWDIERHFWSFLKKSMNEDYCPMIQIPYFGTFSIKYNRVKYIILDCIKNIRADKHVDIYTNRLIKYWAIRNALILNRKTHNYG